MAVSLREAYASGSVSSVADVILLTSKHPSSAVTTYIVVEGDDDMAIYPTFLNGHNINFYQANFEKECLKHPHISAITSHPRSRGKKGVIETVKKVLEHGSSLAVIGICDRDYESYTPTPAPQFSNIFYTDCRDIETTMLSFPSVRQELSCRFPGFGTAFTTSVAVARKTGYYRIYVTATGKDINPNKIIKKSLLWDDVSNTFSNDWEERLQEKIFTDIPQEKIAFEKLISDNKLDAESDYLIMRGHDILFFLHYCLNKNKEDIFTCLIEAFTPEFKNTTLYSNLFQWGKKHNRVLFD